MTDEPPTPDNGIGLGASPSRFSSTGWPGSAPIMSGRRRGRGLLVVAVGVVAVALVVVAVLLVVGRHAPDRDRQRAEAFLAAWSARDTASMQAMVTPSSNVAADMKAVMAKLPVSSATFHLDGTRKVGGRTIASFTVHDVVTGIGPWTYQSSFALVPGHDAPTVVWSRAVIHPGLGPHDVFDRTSTWPARAPILGTGGQVLAGRIDVVTIGVEPRRMTDQAALAKALSDTLHVDPKTVDADLHAPGVQPDYFVPIITVPRPTYLSVKPIIYPIPGLEFQSHKGYASASSGFAEVLLGTVAPITAEQLTHLGAPYEAGDEVGQYGLEATYERSLAGSPSTEIRVIDPTIADSAHRVVAIVRHDPGRAPVALRTTIDPTIQQAADTAMASVDKPAALVAVDGQGDIRAVVSEPLDQQFDRALVGVYPPGSTFKVATTDALLTAGLTPASGLTCPSTVTVDGKVFHNFESESSVRSRCRPRSPARATPPSSAPPRRTSPARSCVAPRPPSGSTSRCTSGSPPSAAASRPVATRSRPRPTPSGRARSPPARCRWRRWRPRSCPGTGALRCCSSTTPPTRHPPPRSTPPFGPISPH